MILSLSWIDNKRNILVNTTLANLQMDSFKKTIPMKSVTKFSSPFE
jgi:hypothetical protein